MGEMTRAVCPSCKRVLPRSRVGTTPLAVTLHKTRSALGYTTRTAAAAAKVDPATYYRAERGFTPDVMNFAALCKWLGVEMADMLPPRRAALTARRGKG